MWGAILATAFFVVATAGLRVYLNYITRTGYTYGALATPIAFAVRVLPGLLNHDRRRVERRHRGGMAGAGTTLATAGEHAGRTGAAPVLLTRTRLRIGNRPVSAALGDS